MDSTTDIILRNSLNVQNIYFSDQLWLDPAVRFCDYFSRMQETPFCFLVFYVKHTEAQKSSLQMYNELGAAIHSPFKVTSREISKTSQEKDGILATFLKTPTLQKG